MLGFSWILSGRATSFLGVVGLPEIGHKDGQLALVLCRIFWPINGELISPYATIANFNMVSVSNTLHDVVESVCSRR